MKPTAQIAHRTHVLGILGTKSCTALVFSAGAKILIVRRHLIHGIDAASVTERTREIGVRVALGAEPGRIVALVLGSVIRVVPTGAAVGIGGALALTGLLKSLLFGVRVHDAATFVAVILMLLSVALVAAYLPARHASRLAPVDALRAE